MGVRIFQASGRRIATCLAMAGMTLVTAAGTVARAATPGGEGSSGTRAFIVVDDKSGHILAGSNVTDKVQIASLTKIATAVVVLDWVRLGGHTLDETVTILGATSVAEGGLQPGDEVSVRDLLYAALLQSDNVAADALAEFVGRDLLHAAPSGERGESARRGGPTAATVRFIAEMNALARELHMDRTRFLNPSGLDSAERPYSTAADLARLTRHALEKADFRFFVSQKDRRITLRRAGAPSDFLVHNTNQLLGSHRIDGVKTGSTAKAGECLVLSAARDPIVKMEGTTSRITPRRVIVRAAGFVGPVQRGRVARGTRDRPLRRVGGGRLSVRSKTDPLGRQLWGRRGTARRRRAERPIRSLSAAASCATFAVSPPLSGSPFMNKKRIGILTSGVTARGSTP